MANKFINLMPKTDVQKKEDKNQESSSIYSAFLPILACLVWIGLVVANASVVKNVNVEKTNVASQEELISSLQSFKQQNGELVVKVEALKSIVNKDVDPNKLFSKIRETLNANSGVLSVTSFERASDGIFTLSGKANSYIDLARIMKKFIENKELTNINIKSIKYDIATNTVTFSIIFEYANNQ